MATEDIIPLEYRKIIRRWVRRGYYVYLHPISSEFVDARTKDKPRIYWIVSVEFRNVEWRQWRAESYNLKEAIDQIDAKVKAEAPKSKPKQPGWPHPEKWLKEEKARLHEAHEKGSKKKKAKGSAKKKPKAARKTVTPKKKKTSAKR